MTQFEFYPGISLGKLRKITTLSAIMAYVLIDSRTTHLVNRGL